MVPEWFDNNFPHLNLFSKLYETYDGGFHCAVADIHCADWVISVGSFICTEPAGFVLDSNFIITTTGGCFGPIDWQSLPPLHLSFIHDPFSFWGFKKEKLGRLCFLPSEVRRGRGWHLRKYQSWSWRLAFLGFLCLRLLKVRLSWTHLVYLLPFAYGFIYLWGSVCNKKGVYLFFSICNRLLIITFLLQTDKVCEQLVNKHLQDYFLRFGGE